MSLEPARVRGHDGASAQVRPDGLTAAARRVVSDAAAVPGSWSARRPQVPSSSKDLAPEPPASA